MVSQVAGLGRGPCPSPLDCYSHEPSLVPLGLSRPSSLKGSDLSSQCCDILSRPVLPAIPYFLYLFNGTNVRMLTRLGSQVAGQFAGYDGQEALSAN